MKKVPVMSFLTGLLLAVSATRSMGTAYTSQASFLSALPGPAGLLNFDSLAGGTDLSGVTLTVSGGPGTGIG